MIAGFPSRVRLISTLQIDYDDGCYLWSHDGLVLGSRVWCHSIAIASSSVRVSDDVTFWRQRRQADVKW